jgi:RND family efflux transporter MFP subunit
MSSPPDREAAPEAHGAEEPRLDVAAHVPKARTVTASALVLGAALVALVALRGLGHRESAARASDGGPSAAAGSGPMRVLVAVARAAPEHPMTLPGRVEALEETAVYARVSGYLRRWMVDIGDAVAAGQPLAEIDTPEIDQEIAQAEAAVGQAEAQVQVARSKRELARVTLERVARLAPAGLVPAQDLDNQKAALEAETANVAAADAALRSARANLGRLEQTKRFARVTAPFAGTITARTAERGALVTVGNGANQSLFQIAATKTVRIFVDVPQSYAPSIQAGESAEVTVREYPRRVFAGKVTRTARALDPAARTLRTEIQVANESGALLPGMYAQASIAGARSIPLLAVPSTAVANDAHGTRVAVVDEGAVRWRSVQVEEDLGREVTVASGLREGERVVTNPSDALRDGTAVEVVSPDDSVR